MSFALVCFGSAAGATNVVGPRRTDGIGIDADGAGNVLRGIDDVRGSRSAGNLGVGVYLGAIGTVPGDDTVLAGVLVAATGVVVCGRC